LKYKTQTQAIKAFCKECLYDEHDEGTYLKQITECTAPECPLYEYRPVDKVERDRRRAIKVAKMTPAELKKYKIKQETARVRLVRTLHSK